MTINWNFCVNNICTQTSFSFEQHFWLDNIFHPNTIFCRTTFLHRQYFPSKHHLLSNNISTQATFLSEQYFSFQHYLSDKIFIWMIFSIRTFCPDNISILTIFSHNFVQTGSSSPKWNVLSRQYFRLDRMFISMSSSLRKHFRQTT